MNIHDENPIIDKSLETLISNFEKTFGLKVLYAHEEYYYPSDDAYVDGASYTIGIHLNSEQFSDFISKGGEGLSFRFGIGPIFVNASHDAQVLICIPPDELYSFFIRLDLPKPIGGTF